MADIGLATVYRHLRVLAEHAADDAGGGPQDSPCRRIRLTEVCSERGTAVPSPTSRAWVAVIHWVRSFAAARAPGGMAGHDPPSVQRTPGRLVSFSDAVFAITITLVALEIKPPTDYTNLLHGLFVL